LRDSPEFELLHDPMLSTVCFRHTPPESHDINQHNVRLAREMQRDGRVFLAPASVDGQACLRVCFVNFRTTPEEVSYALEVTQEIGQRLTQD
jgi:aromatic-L-amino-acid/L-tryptophan decarboxylase